jgi:hypothetical protein
MKVEGGRQKGGRREEEGEGGRRRNTHFPDLEKTNCKCLGGTGRSWAH